ncbi:MAG TPA: hypothetical protein PKV48_05130, partial [Thermodesulfobacteriota bacterium]|nr:hypothetical protein [Thermodesulfobacteriota bacterium]
LIEEEIAKERQQIKTLEAQLADIKHREEVLSNLITYIKKEWPQHIVSLFKKESPTLKKMGDENISLKDALESVQSLSEENARAIKEKFPAFLDDACKSHNLPLDRESRDPRYTFEKGFFTLEIDYQKGMARLSDYEGNLDEFPCDIEAIVESVQKEHKRIFGIKFDERKFLKKLRHQYLAILKKERWPDGYAVPIRRITSRLGKNEKGFRTDSFIVQLSRLVEKGPFEINNRSLDLQQTKDSHQGIYLHGLAGRGYVGYITFKEVK